jgi:hypothetical protein
MSDNHSAYAEVGGLLAAMLENPQAPAAVREAVVAHLDGLLTRANLMRPDVVRMIYPHLVAADVAHAAPGANGGGDNAGAAEAEAVATELAADAAPAAEAVAADGAGDDAWDGERAAMVATAE